MSLKNLSLFLFFLILVAAYFLRSETTTFQKQNEISYQPPKERSIYVGAWVHGFWDNDTKTLNTQVAVDFEKNIAKKLAITNIYADWKYLKNPELISKLIEISTQGWTPIISSNPSFFDSCKKGKENLYKTIALGECDQFLREVSKNLKTYQKPVFLRFAWEMNLPDMYWSIDKLESTPQDFKEAWMRFYKISKEEGAENIVWVLAFNQTNSKSIPYKELYPGDEYVDWVGIDGYNWGNTHSWAGWASFEGVFRKSYDELTAITDKPLMLSEVNSAPTGTGGEKDKWVEDMLNKQIPEKFPRISAIIFFNENKSEGEKVDWRMENDPLVLEVLQKSLGQKIYKSSYP